MAFKALGPGWGLNEIDSRQPAYQAQTYGADRKTVKRAAKTRKANLRKRPKRK